MGGGGDEGGRGGAEDNDEPPKGGELVKGGPDAAAKTPEQLVAEEKDAYDKDSRRTRESMEGLLKFIDDDLADKGFVMPYFEDPLDASTYVAGIVETRRTAQDVRHRGRLVTLITGFTMAWIFAVLTIVVLSASVSGFNIADDVLIVMLSTTTVNVLGLAVIVLKGLFDGEQPDHLRPHAPIAAKHDDAAKD